MQKEELVEVEMWRSNIESRIGDLQQKHNNNVQKLDGALKDIADLKVSIRLQDNRISAVENMLGDIKEDTNWIRRKITGALITATITAVVAGIVGVAITNVF